jgi:hypothetical protein
VKNVALGHEELYILALRSHETELSAQTGNVSIIFEILKIKLLEIVV